MTRAARGLTLLEVVLAVALLATVTVVVVPLLVEATAVAVPPAPRGSAERLRTELVDALASRSSDALPSEWNFVPVNDGRAESGERSAASRPVRVRRLQRVEGDRSHDWIEADDGVTRVLHVVHRAAPSSESDPSEAQR